MYTIGSPEFIYWSLQYIYLLEVQNLSIGVYNIYIYWKSRIYPLEFTIYISIGSSESTDWKL
jgi:hypothetical protein